jgi:hypothetical protein
VPDEQISLASGWDAGNSGTPWIGGCVRRLGVVDVDVGQGAVAHFHRGLEDVVGLPALGVVHQLIGAVDQIRRELACDAAAIGNGAEAETDNADVDPHRICSQPPVIATPIVHFDRVFEPVGDFDRFGASGEIGNQKTEFVAAEPRMQVAGVAATLQRERI